MTKAIKSIPPNQLVIGTPLPLGFSETDQGMNFSFFSCHATAAWLCLFSAKDNSLLYEIALDPKKNKTGSIWHIGIKDLPKPFSYAYRLEGPHDHPYLYNNQLYLLDPYAKQVTSHSKWGSNSSEDNNGGIPYRPHGLITSPEPFDWRGDYPLNIPLQDLIIYEMHVRGFTQSSTSKVKNKGTFLGLIEKIPHLLDMGVNAVELLPLQEFNENENLNINPENDQPLCNYWGYSTVNFFAPMTRYATSTISAVNEFKSMVRELHKNGIEVILDVVFNHTNEGNEKGPITSFKGYENPVYYILNRDFTYSNYTGCGNTVNCNHPVVWELILNCLRYWVLEMHVDGFRFDLASILTRGMQGQPLTYPPIIEALSGDPVLSKIKLIAEPWDLSLYQVGKFYPSAKRWGEWNGKYRDCVRRFIKGDHGIKGEFITRLCGSEDLYHNRSPLSSINFVTVHDGFTLRDLVSYNQKHNIENGEGNRDGTNENDSWNCGEEGPTDDPDVIALRKRQVRNYHLTLMISQGIPMLFMGDEYAHTKHGNNNTWCHDNELNWFLWDQLERNRDFYRFYKLMVKFRKDNKLLRRETFLSPKDAQWHGVEPFKPDWSANTQFIAFTLIDPDATTGNDIYIAFNAQEKEVQVHVPDPRKGKKWHLIADTSALSPLDIFPESKAPECKKLVRGMLGYSALILKAQ